MSDKYYPRLGWWLLAGLLLGASVLTGLLLSKALEYRFAPVLTNVQITRTEPVDGGVLISGTFDKLRDCRFVEISASSGAQLLDLEFQDERKHRAPTRPTGPQVFGPWLISPSVYPLRIVVRHECHPLWFSTTVMHKGYVP